MGKNKILFVVFGLIGALLFGLVALLPVQAATFGQFQITITVAYISINLQDYTTGPYGYWTAGAKNAGDLATMEANRGTLGEMGVLVSNESASTINLLCYATNTKNWALRTYPGHNECVLEVSTYDGWQDPTYPDMAPPTVPIVNSLSPGNLVNSGLDHVSKWWYFRIQTPTSLTDPTENIFTVTVEAIVP